jgi:hypothetical protein
MRKSVSLALAGTVIMAITVSVVAFLLPARHAAQQRQRTVAAERALSRVTLPVSFHDSDDAGRVIRVCVNTVDVRCFVTAGAPRANVAAVKGALAPLATGSITSTCRAVPLPRSPASCDLHVPVAGGWLAVNLFARPSHATRTVPLEQRRYNGSYVEVHVG